MLGDEAIGYEIPVQQEIAIMAACVGAIAQAEQDPDSMRRIMRYLNARFPATPTEGSE